jgi:pimeloyl-ACP methyl ester carboxylesterase
VEVARANGLEIAYERVGEGPPLGAAVDSRMWRPQLTAPADEFAVVAWDEPGAGRSSDVPADFDYAHCLAALVVALDLGPSHVAVCPGAAPSRWSSTVTTPGLSRH